MSGQPATYRASLYSQMSIIGMVLLETGALNADQKIAVQGAVDELQSSAAAEEARMEDIETDLTSSEAQVTMEAVVTKLAEYFHTEDGQQVLGAAKGPNIAPPITPEQLVAAFQSYVESDAGKDYVSLLFTPKIAALQAELDQLKAQSDLEIPPAPTAPESEPPAAQTDPAS